MSTPDLAVDMVEIISRIAPEHCLALSEDRELYHDVCVEAAAHFNVRREELRDLSSDERGYISLLDAVEFRDRRFSEMLKAA